MCAQTWAAVGSYIPEHTYVSLTCSVTEGDLLDVLRMHGAQKQLRQVLTSLKKDKLIRRSVMKQ